MKKIVLASTALIGAAVFTACGEAPANNINIAKPANRVVTNAMNTATNAVTTTAPVNVSPATNVTTGKPNPANAGSQPKTANAVKSDAMQGDDIPPPDTTRKKK